MKVVIIYGFEGLYNGKPEYEYHFPKFNDTHKCMLFISQENEELDFDIAKNEASKFGFIKLRNITGNPLKIEVLNTDLYKGFSVFYEEALKEGSSFVYYPNT